MRVWGSDDALDFLIAIAEQNPKPIEETTLPLLFSSLPDRAPPRAAHAERAKYWRILRWLTKLCLPAPLFETLVVRLSTKLDIICAPLSGVEDPDPEPRAAYAHSILKTLVKVLDIKIVAKHPDVSKYIDRLLPRLFNLFIYLATSEKERGRIDADPRLLDVAGQIITLIVQSVPAE